MNEQQWRTLVAVVRGEKVAPIPVGFIIDSPWLPNWAGHSILDYYTDDRIFFEDNLRAIQAFPSALMLPGFWSEFGMCTEPSAFGAVPVIEENAFPFARMVLHSAADVDRLQAPNVRTDGLLPLVIRRLHRLQPCIRSTGHEIRFAVTRGPLNIASFLMGATEFLTALRTDADAMQRLLTKITDFLVEWIRWQRTSFPSIDGVLVLDDIVGLIGPRDFETFALPHMRRIFATDVTIKFFHNDAPCKVAAPFFEEIGINLLNFGVQHSISEMRQWAGDSIALMGNIPPRDVMAAGTEADVARAVMTLLNGVHDTSRLILSCGGGMPPGVPTRNIEAFITTATAALVS